jgi:S-adenosylmethionine-dependent methyltransferase
MEAITPDEYDEVVDEWKKWQSYPWGKLLYTISRSNIQRHIANSPLRILDVGGGNGFNSIYFAGLGHTVTLLDYSPAMLANARKTAEKEGLFDRITFCQADVRDAPHLFHDEHFDMVICHLMLEFVPQPLMALKGICELIAQGGCLSILDANRYSEVYRKAFQANDLRAAREVIETKEYFHPWFERVTPLYSSTEIGEILRANGCEIVGSYGVLCLCAYLPNEPKYEAEYFQALEQLELCLTDTNPYKLLARFYQVVVQKQL